MRAQVFLKPAVIHGCRLASLDELHQGWKGEWSILNFKNILMDCSKSSQVRDGRTQDIKLASREDRLAKIQANI